METRKWPVLVAIFYPFAVTAMAAGFLAFVMLILKLDFLIVSTVVLLFYFACASTIYVMSKEVLRTFNLHRLFLSFTLAIGVIAFLSAFLLGIGLSGNA